MNRRSLLSGLGAAALVPSLAACEPEGDKATIRFRVIAAAEVDGERVEASAVMEMRYFKVTRSLHRYGARSEQFLDTIVLDLKGRGTVFVLPSSKYSTSTFRNAYDHWMIRFAGSKKGGPGVLEAEDYRMIREFRGRRAYRDFVTLEDSWPLMVGFKDEADPNSIYEVNPRDFATSFGAGVRFLGILVETTDAPVTTNAPDRLAWVKKDPDGLCGFERPPPGPLPKPIAQYPLRFHLICLNFYKKG